MDIITLEEYTCNMKSGYIGKTTYFPKAVSFPLNKRYKHNALVTKYIYGLNSGGLLDHMRAKYTKRECLAEERKTVHVMLLSHFQGAFLVYSCGLTSALVVLFGSMAMNKITFGFKK